MELIVWLALAFTGFAVLQVALYLYFYGDSSGEQPTMNLGARTDTGPDSEPSPTEFVTPGPDETRTQPEPDRTTCTHCGAENERNSVYTYCQRCLEPLG